MNKNFFICDMIEGIKPKTAKTKTTERTIIKPGSFVFFFTKKKSQLISGEYISPYYCVKTKGRYYVVRNVYVSEADAYYNIKKSAKRLRKEKQLAKLEAKVKQLRMELQGGCDNE